MGGQARNDICAGATTPSDLIGGTTPTTDSSMPDCVSVDLETAAARLKEQIKQIAARSQKMADHIHDSAGHLCFSHDLKTAADALASTATMSNAGWDADESDAQRARLENLKFQLRIDPVGCRCTTRRWRAPSSRRGGR